MHSVETGSVDWRSLAYAFGSLLVGDDEPNPGLVAHELRSPVAVIKAYAQLLEAQLGQKQAPAGSHEIATHILDQAEFMSNWVDCMLHVGHAAQRMRIDLTALAWRVARDVQRTTHKQNIRVEARRGVPPSVVGDGARLSQALANLVDNAVKYAPQGTIRIQLGVQADGKRALVTVADHGCGLAADDINRIFSPFEQAHSARGLGLGLYLARQIARDHGGDVWAESRGHGKGSAFVLALPVAG